jgi:hypothetical protein
VETTYSQINHTVADKPTLINNAINYILSNELLNSKKKPYSKKKYTPYSERGYDKLMCTNYFNDFLDKTNLVPYFEGDTNTKSNYKINKKEESIAEAEEDEIDIADLDDERNSNDIEIVEEENDIVEEENDIEFDDETFDAHDCINDNLYF